MNKYDVSLLPTLPTGTPVVRKKEQLEKIESGSNVRLLTPDKCRRGIARHPVMGVVQCVSFGHVEWRIART